jgi:hypothetical protein
MEPKTICSSSLTAASHEELPGEEPLVEFLLTRMDGGELDGELNAAEADVCASGTCCDFDLGDNGANACGQGSR